MAKTSKEVCDQDAEFSLILTQDEQGSTLQELWDRHKNHAGLSDEQAALDIVQLDGVKMSPLSRA